MIEQTKNNIEAHVVEHGQCDYDEIHLAFDLASKKTVDTALDDLVAEARLVCGFDSDGTKVFRSPRDKRRRAPLMVLKDSAPTCPTAVLELFARKAQWSRSEVIRALPDRKVPLIDKALTRLIDKNEIERLGYGKYRLKAAENATNSAPSPLDDEREHDAAPSTSDADCRTAEQTERPTSDAQPNGSNTIDLLLKHTLNACPWCQTVEQLSISNPGTDSAYVQCGSCGGSAGLLEVEPDEWNRRAVEKWNSRDEFRENL